MASSKMDDKKLKDILSNKKFDVLDDSVEDLNKRFIRISKKEMKAVNKNFREVMSVLEETMRKVDSTFDIIFNRFTYCGSFFDGLKIGSADEYDVNAIIKPELKLKPRTRERKCPPGHIAIQVVEDEQCASTPYKSWLHQDKESKQFFLKINEVSSWLQSIVVKAVEKIVENELLPNCKFDKPPSKAGPAWTLKLTFENPERKLSIDIVPCLEFDNQSWPVPRKSQRILNGKDKDPWFAVPKGPRKIPEDLSNNELWFFAWKMSFPIQEKRALKHPDLKYLKYSVKLLKLVRDQFKIHEVASYYIKTLALWEIENNKDKEMWSSRRGRLFMYMLNRFQQALENECIPFFWDKECNLLGHVSTEYLQNNAGQVKNFIEKLNRYIDEGKDKELEIFMSKLERKQIRKTYRYSRYQKPGY